MFEYRTWPLSLTLAGPRASQVACKYGRVECVKLLIDNCGADVNASGGLGRYTPLCYAAYHGHADVVAALLERGANRCGVLLCGDMRRTHNSGFALS
jgi:ankyrin repeat protein